MELLKSRQIVNCCHPNALMTLKEFLEDYADPQTKQIGEKLIAEELKKIPKLSTVLPQVSVSVCLRKLMRIPA